MARWFLALAFSLGLATSTSAQQPGASGSVPQGVARATLPNGLRVVVVPDKLAPVVATSLSYLAGSNDAPPGFPGTAHALEHMMFRGSEGLEKDQLYELSALLGGVYNASTTETVTQYTYTVPADDLGLALHVEALRMGGANLTQTDWEQERGAIEQEVSRDLSSPIYNYFAKAQAILFAGTPYEHDALGTRPSFDLTDAALLRTFYQRWYAPNNAILVIAGDVDPQAALAQARDAFGAIPARPIPAHAAFTLNPVQPATLELPTDLPSGLVTLAYRMPGLTSPDFAAADMLSDILSSQRFGIYGLVPAGRALSAQFGYQALAGVGYGVLIASFPRGSDPAPLLADLRRILAETAQNGVPAELVEAVRRREISSLAFSNNSVSGLARTWSDALAFQGAQSPDDLVQAYQAVTVDDVNRLARTLLDPEHVVTAILTPQEDGKPISGGGFGGAESFNTPPDHPVELPAWAASALAELHVPDPIDPPDVSVLPNGLRLIVQPERIGHTVSVYGRVRSQSSIQEPGGHEGISTLTSRMFAYGTEQLDRLAFRSALDDITADVTAGQSFSLAVLTPDFASGMALLAGNELHPALPAEAFMVARRQLAQSLAGQLRSPDYRFERAQQAAQVPADDPTLRQATPATVSSLELGDVRDYLKAAYRPDLTTIVVIGDVSPADARHVVEDTFGAWQAEGSPPQLLLPPVGASTASETRIANPSSQQDRVSLSETLGLTIADADRYALELGNVILGSGFSSRLYQDLRVRTGYVYSVGSSVGLGLVRSYYDVEFGADSANVSRARELVQRDIKEMQSTAVADAELQRAKALYLRRLPMQRANVAAIGAQYLRLAGLNLPVNEADVAARRTLALTSQDIRNAFVKYLRPDDLAQVVQGPPLPQ